MRVIIYKSGGYAPDMLWQPANLTSKFRVWNTVQDVSTENWIFFFPIIFI